MVIQLGSYKVLAKPYIYISLLSIYGIGRSRSLFLHFKNGAHNKQRISHASVIHRKIWLIYLKKYFILSDHLQILKKENIKRFQSLKSFRGLRHKKFLPVRGQRTRSNNRTSRYLSCGTWHFVPSSPNKKLKKIRKYIRHKVGLAESSNKIYLEILKYHFNDLKTDKRAFQGIIRQGSLGQFAKLAKQKVLKKNKIVKK